MILKQIEIIKDTKQTSNIEIQTAQKIELQNQIQLYHKKKEILYEQYIKGKLTEEQFIKINLELTKELEPIQNKLEEIDFQLKYSKNKKTIASPGQTSPPGKTPLSSVKNCTPGGRKCQFPFLTKVNVRIWCASVRRIEMHKGCFDGKDAFGVVTEIQRLKPASC